MLYAKIVAALLALASILGLGAKLGAWYENGKLSPQIDALQKQIAGYATAKSEGEAKAREEQKKADDARTADLKAKNDAAAASVADILAQNKRLSEENARIQHALVEAYKNDPQSKNWLDSPIPDAVRAAYGVRTGAAPAASPAPADRDKVRPRSAPGVPAPPLR
jgi:hypothetical protein